MSTVLPSAQAEHADWKDYAGLLAAAHRAFFAEIDSLIGRLPLVGAHRVLDVPSGDGFYAEILARHLAPEGEVVAADVEDNALEQVRRRAGKLSKAASLTGISADIYSLPFAEGDFDLAWCAQSLISLSEPQEMPEGPGVHNALCEIHRILKPGGHIALLEQDAMHHVLLPWPAELELSIHEAHRRGFARKHGRSDQLHIGRQLGKLLAEAGFQPIERLTLCADRQGRPEGDLRTFLLSYFHELRERIAPELKPEELQEFDRLTDPGSEASFFGDPSFEMTWLEFVSVGQKPRGKPSAGYSRTVPAVGI